MSRKNERQSFTYDTLRRMCSSDVVAMELWRVISTTKMKFDKANQLLNTVNELPEESQQIKLISVVWDRYYKLIAEQLLP